MAAMKGTRYFGLALVVALSFGCVTQNRRIEVLKYSIANWTTEKVVRGVITFGDGWVEPFGVLSPNVAKAYSFYGTCSSQQGVSLDWITEGGYSNHYALAAGELPSGIGKLLFQITGTNRVRVVRTPQRKE